MLPQANLAFMQAYTPSENEAQTEEGLIRPVPAALGHAFELQKVFKQDIPLKERDAWEEWLAAQRATHAQQTADIIRLETDLNARVYALFDLSPAEIALIGASTKYRYGEV